MCVQSATAAGRAARYRGVASFFRNARSASASSAAVFLSVRVSFAMTPITPAQEFMMMRDERSLVPKGVVDALYGQ